MAGLAEILEENSRLRDTERVLREALKAQAEETDLLRQQVEALRESNDLLKKHFDFLEEKRKRAAAERYIVSKNQGLLFADEVAPPRDPVVEEADEKRPKKSEDKRKTAKHKRKGRRKVEALPFPKQKVTAPLTQTACRTCGGETEPKEAKVTHRVGWNPGQFVVLEVHQEQCTCADPECTNVETLTAPEPFLLPGAMCDDSLLTRVLVDKFGDHIPLNRQAARLKREGFSVGSNVLSGWVQRASTQVQLLVNALREQVAASPLLLSDDSGFPVQDGSEGKLANGRLWVTTDQKQAFFIFSRTKEGVVPAGFLTKLNVAGRLLVDGGSEYNLAVNKLGLDRAGCWSHLRRYFVDAAIQHDEAEVALTAIHDLYMIERDLVDKPPAERLAIRQARTKPIVDGLYRWVHAMNQKNDRPKSKLGQALGYAISQEQRMRVFLQHGDVPIHNNLSELLLRQPIVGRKNWLFARTEGGAEAAANWFSLIASCILQAVDPAVYLYDVFGRILDHPAKWIHELTPLNWRLAVDAGDFKPRSHPAIA